MASAERAGAGLVPAARRGLGLLPFLGLLRSGALIAVAVGGVGLPAAAAVVGGQYVPGRWAYHLLPRSELVPLVGAAWIMRLVRTLPHDMREGRDTALFELLELYLAITALVLILTLSRRLGSDPTGSLAERKR